jgi:hypothetical protein
MKNWTFKLLPDLPAPPQDLIDRIDLVYRPRGELFSPDNNEYLSITKVEEWKDQTYNWIKPMASNNNVRYPFTKEYNQWVCENITDQFNPTNSGVMFFDSEQLPHTDTTREYVLLYNVETGGESQVCFWQEDGYPVLRERGLAVERGAHLKLIDKIDGPYNVWYLLNTRIIHSVENTTSRRTNFQVSFNQLPEKFQ